MNKWVVLVVALMMVAGVQAAEEKSKGKGKGPVTKEKYIANQKKRAEKAGKEFDQAKAEKVFSKLDKNGDGVLTKDEMPPKKGKKKEKGKKGADEE